MVVGFELVAPDVGPGGASGAVDAAPAASAATTTTTTTTTTRPHAHLGSAALRLERVHTIRGDITPKSVVHSGAGLFVAQNMMYSHTVTVYDRDHNLVATIPDTISAQMVGGDSPTDASPDATLEGAPVEAAFTSDGAVAYVSNYQMYGPGYANPGGDDCGSADWDDSLLYRIPMDTLEIDAAIEVGAVPKFLAVTPDDRHVLVANWCSHDLSVVDIAASEEIARVEIGRHPRGIAVSPDSTTAYVAVMGGTEIAVVDIESRSVSDRIGGVGANPRHLVMSPDGRFLYATLNGDGRVAKIDLASREVVDRVTTGSAPRSMTISDDGESIYVVNYRDDTVSKVTTADMTEIDEVAAGSRPIGATYDGSTRRLWVANYSGSIMVYDDRVEPGADES